ncbi:MAG: MIP family channel protein [Thiotrichales bacterium]|jgi:aquaporin Z|nr:MIP family channel protein [Thiotrichales bacterium]MBT3854646.1 MIP family channel protein [Thiotrichales bacterium]MBT4653236.1 MIP family channel protein [Thiotrichales bacterium]MBT5499510.1 MIP family channel protein [Thiotrichales bacterium]MBT5983822.1 MIP family channel protein [Thiotrichales bacterium]
MKKKLIAELLGAFILVFAGTGAIIINDITNAIGHVGVALTFGFVIVALIYSFAHVSGAHFNPAVTIAFWSMGEFERKNVIPYIAAQLVGGLLASLSLFLLLKENFVLVSEVSYLGATIPSGTASQSFGFEFILTFILMIVICSSAIHGKATKDFAGLAIGLTVGLESMFAGPITGASMNPARSIAPALISGNVEHLWIYIVATILGAVCAAVVFMKVFKSND